MLRALIDAYRRAQAFRDIDNQMARLRLGMHAYEREEQDRQRRAGNAFAVAMILIGSAGFIFAALDPIFDTLDQLLQALK